MFSSMAITETRGLTAQHFSTPRTSLTIRVASASLSTSSAITTNGRPAFYDFVEQRQHVLQ
jgi:hypothetical protein